MLQLSHINLHFDFKNSLQCIYLIINVIFTLLENIFMNFKVFLLIFDISIFIIKYPPIYLRYIRYIHKMQVSIYPSKPIFPTLETGVDPTRSTGRRDSLLNGRKMWIDFRVLENPFPRRNVFLWSRQLLLVVFYEGEKQVRTKNPNDSSMEKAVCKN